MHLRHVRAPQHECIGGLEVIVTAHRLVHAERPHEALGGRCHAVARIRIEVVGAKAGLEQLVGRVAFPDRPLARAEHADGAWPAFGQRVLELQRHHVESFVPGNLGEFAVLVVLAVLLAQERMREAIVAVHDFREKISFDAIESAIDLGLSVAMRRDNTIVFRCNHDAATSAAKPARRLVPFQLGDRTVGEDVLRGNRRGETPGRRCHRGRFQFQEFAAVESFVFHRRSPIGGTFSRYRCPGIQVLPSTRVASMKWSSGSRRWCRCRRPR